MRKSFLIALLGILILLTSTVPAMAIPSADNPGREPIDKMVFIHYPKHELGKPGAAVGGSGALSQTYKYPGIHWANALRVHFSINPTDCSHIDTVAAVNESFAAWGNASGTDALDFYYDGLTANQAGKFDKLNVISWADISEQYPGAIAVTSVWYTRYSKEIAEVDTQMNSEFSWSYTQPDITSTVKYADPDNSGTPGCYDIRNIMTHEAGHWLMLGDLYTSRDSQLTMYGYAQTGELIKDTLGYGDILGLQKVYGR